MASKKNETQENAHYLNVTLSNEEKQDQEEIVFSLSEVLRQFKRFLLPWFLVAVIVGGLITGIYVLLDASPAKPVTALVSFTYSGIEDGKNPDGSEFQADKLKAPEVIQAALKECGLEAELLEKVRHGVVISPIIPSDAMDRITTYSYLYENAQSGSLNAAEKMMEVSWFSTQYQLKFDYSETGLSRDVAAQLLNEMTEAYRDCFIRDFGYNDALGNSLKVINYTDYDYAEAVDIMSDNLSKLRSYVNSLSKDDTIRFRSNVTGYTFADLRTTIDTIRENDLDLISSYITQNNVTKDKDRLQAFYEYRIEDLSRSKIVYEERLASTKESIESYQKDSIYVFANDTNMESTTASDQYDKMIADKLELQANLSSTAQRIEYYNQRLAVLRKSTIGSTDKVKKVETDLENVSEKVVNLIELVEKTADDYYQNYSLTDSYNILVPASYSAREVIVDGIKDAIKLTFAVELILLALYFIVAFVSALVISNRNRKAQLAAENAAAQEAETAAQDAAPAEEEKASAEDSAKSGKGKK